MMVGTVVLIVVGAFLLGLLVGAWIAGLAISNAAGRGLKW